MIECQENQPKLFSTVNIEFSEDDVSFIKQTLGINHLAIVVRSDWGSNSAHYRESIHVDLKKQIAKACPFSDSSISHSQGLGGYVLSIFDTNRAYQIGFDIEETRRVRPELAKRVSYSEEEFTSSESPASLWVAKESSFKCLKGPKQPLVVSEIEIGEWRKVNSRFDIMLVKNAKKFGFNFIKGCSFKKIVNHNSYHFCIFVAKL